MHLARREHHLAVLAVDHVAVVVHVGELVVRPDLLKLAVGLQQRRVVPEADVLDREVVAAQILAGQVLLGGEVPLLDVVELVGQARVLDVPLDVGPLEDDLVGDDLELLHEGRVNPPAENEEGRDDTDGHDGDQRLADKGIGDDRRPAERGDDHEGLEDPELGRHVGVARAEDDPALGEQDLVEREPRPEDTPEEKERHEDQQVPLRPRRQAEDLRRPDDHGLADDVDHGRGDEGEEVQTDEPAEDVAQQGKLEDVEPDVLPEEGVVHPEGRGVDVQQQVLPLIGPGERGKQAEQKGDCQDQELQGLIPGGHVDRVTSLVQLELRGQAVGRGEVQEEEQEVGDAEERGRLELRDQADGEDVLVTHLLEPEPVRDQAGCPPEEKEQGAQGEGQDKAARQFCRRPDGADVDHDGGSPFILGFPGFRASVAHYRVSPGGCQGTCPARTLTRSV